MELALNGRRALVGGASRGIGRASAVELAKLGAEVTVMARTADDLQSVVENLDSSAGQTHRFIVADVQDDKGLINSVEKHVEDYGGFHIVVNNSGGPAGGPLEKADVSNMMQAIHDHIVISHLLMQSLVPFMRTAGFGRIINIISTSVKQPIEGLGVSNVTRGGMASWAKTLAAELGADGITVNNVLPGATSTERLSSIIERKVKNSGSTEEDVTNALLAEIPANRFGLPEEVANAVGFLASPAASYVNGTSILVDGGRTRSLS